MTSRIRRTNGFDEAQEIRDSNQKAFRCAFCRPTNLLVLFLLITTVISFVCLEPTFLSTLSSNKPMTTIVTNTASAQIKSFIDHQLVKHPLQFNNAVNSSILKDSEIILNQHPLYQFKSDQHSLEDVLYLLHQHPSCIAKPIFVSMAQVGTELYWQMIENFVYTMVKFNLSDCAIMICVTDQNCMDMCKVSKFPCLYYGHDLYHPGKPLPSALEQIASLKLFILPRALEKGVTMVMLDLDVGFLENPMILLNRSVSFMIVVLLVTESMF